MRSRGRVKVFGPGSAVPLDRNAKARIVAYARAWDRRHRQPGQRGGALGRAALDVLGALLWVFHNAWPGQAFPSYETIAAKKAAAPAPPSPRLSKPWSSPVCSPGRTASPGSASVAVICSAATTGAGG